MHTPVLSDAYLLPDVSTAPGNAWSVDGSQFAGFLDPSFRWMVAGRLVAERAEDPATGDRRRLNLRVCGGSLNMKSLNDSHRRCSRLAPMGTLRCNPRGGFVETADLTGRFTLSTRGEDHLMSHVPLVATLSISYSCRIRRSGG